MLYYFGIKNNYENYSNNIDIINCKSSGVTGISAYLNN